MGEIWSGERHITTEQLDERAARVATGLDSIGVKAGDTVALYMRNDIVFFEAQGGAGAIGAYPVAVNWHYTEDEARYLFENSQARVIVIHADLLGPVRSALPADATVIVVRTPPEVCAAYGVSPADAEVPAGMIEWESWVSSFEPWTKPPHEAPTTIIYTSGTTGRPKGVRRFAPTPSQAATQRSLFMRGFGFGAAPDPSQIVTVLTGPMYHAAPVSYSSTAARLGGTVILQPRFDAEDLLKLIETRKVTHLHMVPIMFNRLLKLPDAVRAKYDVSSLVYVVHAAAPCPPQVKRQMIDWWGPVICEYYGTTEISMVAYCDAEEWLAHPGTVGRAFPESVVKVVDEAGNDLAPREVGEVLARTPGITDFTYQGDDQKRKDSEKIGLIAPGDIGYFDEDGFLYLCDRSKDMIISGGVNIYPAEIEAELHKMPGVVDCAVFGVPDDEWGEAIHAVVQPHPEAGLSEADVRAFLRERVAGYKVPKRVDFSAELPREDSGKIFRRKLRESFWAGMERRI
ncbi:MAG: acyl-CoA synthetase [Phenylobacterium sp.]|uniref:acyl-CoA synthetase n=1 Tax=Phenylobacterium sp. TaxID=1871053 RepID=UPI002736B29F|nr:acyl-CoA synthetase [Phenylobacterium sp.]MDP3175031.1 acyl-CoA synthetase [Phenylobacterium sp.]